VFSESNANCSGAWHARNICPPMRHDCPETRVP